MNPIWTYIAGLFTVMTTLYATWTNYRTNRIKNEYDGKFTAGRLKIESAIADAKIIIDEKVTESKVQIEQDTLLFAEYRHLVEGFKATITNLQSTVNHLEEGLTHCEKHHQEALIENTSLRSNMILLQKSIDELQRSHQVTKNIGTIEQHMRESGALVVSNETGAIMEWSYGAQILFGFTKEDAAGQQIADLLVPLDLREAHNTAFRRLMASQRTTISHQIKDMRALTKVGDEIRVNINVQGYKKGEHWIVTAVFLQI